MADDEQTNVLPPEMVETSDLPNDDALKEAYAAMRTREPAADQVLVAAAAAENESNTPMKIACHSCGQKLDLSTMPAFAKVACPVCGTELIVPKWFDNYLLEEICGVGGMATVYRALDVALDREVAIKVLNDDLSGQQDRSEMFLQEARTAATINHYAVIPIYTCGIFEGQTYIVMQFMSGGSLEDLLASARAPLPLPHVMSWIRDIATGLENAWQHGIIHHDIKPANIMLDQDGKAKVGDFGIAQIADNNASTDAARSWVSPHYVSPEKLLTGQEDYRGDIYSLGATFYHLVTGVPPFNSDDLDELLRIRVNEDPVSPALHRQGLPEAMVQLILDMLARNPEQRPDYSRIIKALNALLNRSAGTPKKRKAAASAGQRTAAPKMRMTAQKQKVPAAVVLLRIFAHLFSLTVLLGITIYVLDRYDRLNAFADYLPRFMQEKKKSYEAEKRLNTELINSFQSGDPENVIRSGEDVLRREFRGKRYQAALQLAYAAYLVNSKEKPVAEYVRSISTALHAHLKPVDRIVYEDSLALLSYLAGETEYDLLDSETKFSHASDYAAKLALAELLIRLQTEPDMLPQTRGELLANFKAELDGLVTESCWLRDAFEDRIPYWNQVIETGTGIIDETEPLFRSLIKEEAKWTFPQPRKLRKKTRSLEDTVKDFGTASKIIISTMRVKDGQAKFQALERPQYEFPMDIFNSKIRMERYAASLPDIADKDMVLLERRVLMRLQLILPHMVAATAGPEGGLPVQPMIWKQKRREIELDAGTVVFTDRNIQLIPEDCEDEEEDTIFLSWLDLSPELLKKWLAELAERRCTRPLASQEEVGSLGVTKDRLERADLWLDTAYIASWYNDLELLEKALKNAAAESNANSVEDQISNIFLKVVKSVESPAEKAEDAAPEDDDESGTDTSVAEDAESGDEE